MFALVWTALKDDGTLWLNLGDSYANDSKWGGASGGKHAKALHGATGIGRGKKESGLKSKDLVGIPWRVAFALQAAGWYLRSDIIWHKPNPMPESVTDRPTRSHEYIFLLSKSAKYYYDSQAIKEPGVSAGRPVTKKAAPRATDKQRGHGRRHDGFNERWDAMEKTEQCSGLRNKRDVWQVAPANFRGAHFATFPPALIEPCILAGCPVGGTVLDPFGGSGTVAEVAIKHRRRAILCELNPEYVKIIETRLGLDLV